MRANAHNEKLFPDSLSPAAIEQMAADLRAHGQEQPILVRPDGTIINGQRRWRAAQILGWAEVNVFVEDVPDDQILARILGSCSASRQMTLREKANVYSTWLEHLKKMYGRPRGRPGAETVPSGDVFLNPEEIKQRAATRAMFDSVTRAERTLAVFTRGDAELKAALSSGEMTLTAAYNELPKRPKAKREAKGKTSDSEVETRHMRGPSADAPGVGADASASAGASAPAETSEEPLGEEHSDDEDSDVARESSAVSRQPSTRSEFDAERIPRSQPGASEKAQNEARPEGAIVIASKTVGRANIQRQFGYSDSNVMEDPFSVVDKASEEHRPRFELTEDDQQPDDVNVSADEEERRRAFELALDVVDRFIGVLAEQRPNEAADTRNRVVRRLDATLERCSVAKAATRIEVQVLTTERVDDNGDRNAKVSLAGELGRTTTSSKGLTDLESSQRSPGGRTEGSSREKARRAGLAELEPSKSEIDAVINPWRTRK